MQVLSHEERLGDDALLVRWQLVLPADETAAAADCELERRVESLLRGNESSDEEGSEGPPRLREVDESDGSEERVEHSWVRRPLTESGWYHVTRADILNQATPQQPRDP